MFLIIFKYFLKTALLEGTFISVVFAVTSLFPPLGLHPRTLIFSRDVNDCLVFKLNELKFYEELRDYRPTD